MTVNPNLSSSVIIVPETGKGHGGGHLCRCITLTNNLRNMGKEAFLFIPPQDRDLTDLYMSFNFNPKWCITNEELRIRNEVLGESFNCIIMDRFKTPLEEILRWKKIAPVIGIDEGGVYRDSFDFLIDILIPEKIGKPKANIVSAGLLFNTAGARLKEINHRVTQRIKILITFGQEDLAGLGVKTALALSAVSDRYNLDITLLRGALSKNKEQLTINNVRALDVIPNLAEHLAEYDIVITHYGITAYEALYAGTNVLLDHPTPYHKKLAKAAGFKDIKYIYKFFRVKPANLLSGLQKAQGKLKNKFTDGLNLTDLLDSFSPLVNKKCPVCGAEVGKSIARFTDRTYRRCTKCEVIYMDRINPPPIEYGEKYFFESYIKQYGKTYLEDFNNIKEAGKRRLKVIKSLSALQENNKKILDIGCAYGPFLAAAKEEGCCPAGIDPAEEAINYARQTLGVSADHGFFPNLESLLLKPNYYNIITLWYVIEHFTDCVTVLSEIKKLLTPGGILAFSTPSSSGVSGRSNPRNFLSESPADHWTIWSPKMVKKALSFSGFKVKKIIIAGHHPQRFPLFGKFAKSKKSPVYWLLLTVSKIFGLGDTFEVYAKSK